MRQVITGQKTSVLVRTPSGKMKSVTIHQTLAVPTGKQYPYSSTKRGGNADKQT